MKAGYLITIFINLNTIIYCGNKNNVFRVKINPYHAKTGYTCILFKKRVDQDYLVSDQDPHCFSLLVHVCFLIIGILCIY